MSETRDHVSIHINERLLDLASSLWRPPIFRVHDDIRGVNEKLYDPKVVSIGPFHLGKGHLQKMEKHKLRYLQLLLELQGESSVDKYIKAMRSVEENARRCYDDPVEFSSDMFVEMLLLDGCFVVELIRNYGLNATWERDDLILQYKQVLSQLRHDLVLVETQVPFFVIDKLFSATRTGHQDDDILLFVGDVSPWPDAAGATSGEVCRKSVDHLLGLMYKTWCPSFPEIVSANKPDRNEKERKTLSINSVKELQAARIKFQKVRGRNTNRCLDIKFSEGVQKIPCFDVSDETESILRNLITYEHFLIDNHPRYVTDYAYFMHCLINSSKDVETLRLRGILSNLPGHEPLGQKYPHVFPLLLCRCV